MMSLRTPPAICVDDDLAACEASISLWASNDELPRRIDVKMGVITIQGDCRLAVLELDLLKALHNHILLDLLVHHLHGWRGHLWSLVPITFLAAHGLRWLSMLCRDDNGVNLQGLHRAVIVLLVLNGHLGLAIGPQPPQRSILADIGQLLAQTCGNEDCQGHADLSLIRSVTKHNALVSCTHIHLVLANMDTTCNVRTLLVDPDQDLAGLVAQTLAVDTGQALVKRVIANALDRLTHNLVIVELGRGGDLAKDHDHVVLGCSLACNFALGILPEACIQDCI